MTSKQEQAAKLRELLEQAQKAIRDVQESLLESGIMSTTDEAHEVAERLRDRARNLRQ